MKSIGNKIKEIRKANNLTQDEFSKRISISRPLLSQIESGNSNPSLETLKLIVDNFNIDANDLFNIDKDNVSTANKKEKKVSHNKNDIYIDTRKDMISNFENVCKLQLKKNYEIRQILNELKISNLDLGEQNKDLDKLNELANKYYEEGQLYNYSKLKEKLIPSYAMELTDLVQNYEYVFDTLFAELYNKIVSKQPGTK